MLFIHEKEYRFVRGFVLEDNSHDLKYNQYNKLKIMLKNNLISILDQAFPGVNTLFNTPARKKDGHEKWIDFVLKFPHCDCISRKSYSVFSKCYLPIWKTVKNN